MLSKVFPHQPTLNKSINCLSCNIQFTTVSEIFGGNFVTRFHLNLATELPSYVQQNSFQRLAVVFATMASGVAVIMSIMVIIHTLSLEAVD